MRHQTVHKKNRERRARALGERGFELVEIVVATGIISLSLLSVIVIASQALVISHRTLNTYQAATLLEEGAEAVHTIRDTDWAELGVLTSGTTYYPYFDTGTNTWALTTSSADGEVGMFTRSVVLADVVRDNTTNAIDTVGTPDAGTRLVTVTVAWTESDGRAVSKTLALYLSDLFS